MRSAGRSRAEGRAGLGGVQYVWPVKVICYFLEKEPAAFMFMDMASPKSQGSLPVSAAQRGPVQVILMWKRSRTVLFPSLVVGGAEKRGTIVRGCLRNYQAQGCKSTFVDGCAHLAL